MSTNHTPKSELGRRFRLCETHRVSVWGEGEPCEICELQQHKTALLAACEQSRAHIMSWGEIGSSLAVWLKEAKEVDKVLAAAIAAAEGETQ